MSKVSFNKHWLLVIFLLFASHYSPGLQAHEFWIEPLRFQLSADKPLIASLRVGEKMRGETLYYYPDAFESFNITVGDKTRPIESEAGDSPAINEVVTENGLHIISYVSSGSTVTYEEDGKFQRFLKHEGLEWVEEKHQQRNLPSKNFSESYQRFAKSLVSIGDGQGKDQPLGLAFEMVLETNPYTEQSEDIVVRLLWNGQAFPKSQINVFQKQAGNVTLKAYTTDSEGRIYISRNEASGIFLLNAVHITEPPSDEKNKDVVWKSFWASTTFEIK